MILASLIITFIVYLSFPIIFRLAKGTMTRKRAKKYALFNSLSGYFFFTFLYIILEINATVSALPPITYYFIAKAILTSREEKIKEKVKRIEKKFSLQPFEENQKQERADNNQNQHSSNNNDWI